MKKTSSEVHDSAAPTMPARNGRLRILMVAPQPFFRPRGTPFSTLHRIRALLSAGHTVDLVTYPFGEDIEMPGLRYIRCDRPRLVKDVKLGPSIAKIFLDLKLYRATKKLLRENTYDVLHTHEEAAFFGVGLAKKHKLLHVYDMHSSLPQQLKNFSSFNFSIARSAFRRLEEKVLTTCDGVITICQDLADIATVDCGDTPHCMIENTADDSRVFRDASFDARREHGLAGKRILLYTGTFEKYQGIDLLLESFQFIKDRFPDAHLLLVGGNEKQIAHYKAQAQELDLEDRTTFTGTVHPSMIPSFINAAEIIVSPRISGTNIPLKVYGYLRTGVPVVATDLLTHSQTMTPDISVLAPPTPEGFGAGIAQLLDDPELGANLANAAKEFMEAGNFSDAAYMNRVVGFYDDVLIKARARQ